METDVNLYRAMERITSRLKKRVPCSGLFIDFANAYNSVPHTRLFQKLEGKNIFSGDELKYLKCLYSRYKIRIGKETIKSNKGVAQGSIISPALFNIYIEDLSQQLRKEADLNLEGILFYADDILLLCDSLDQLTKAIQIIESWARENGMDLNKKKSGIVPLTGRRSKKTNMAKNVSGIPVLGEYKYLGTLLTAKLDVAPQIKHLQQKSDFLYFKLFPYLKNASADGRRDMWQTIVMPLFNAIQALYEYEPSKTMREKSKRVWRMTFKKFLMVPRATPST